MKRSAYLNVVGCWVKESGARPFLTFVFDVKNEMPVHFCCQKCHHIQVAESNFGGNFTEKLHKTIYDVEWQDGVAQKKFCQITETNSFCPRKQLITTTLQKLNGKLSHPRFRERCGIWKTRWSNDVNFKEKLLETTNLRDRGRKRSKFKTTDVSFYRLIPLSERLSYAWVILCNTIVLSW